MTIPTLDEIIDRANASHRSPVIFIHGLWQRPSVWERWVAMFEATGYAALAPAWPAQAGGAAAPETIAQLVSHFTDIAGALDHRPGIVGHAFGGLIAQVLASHGLAAATVAIDPAPPPGTPAPDGRSDHADLGRILRGKARVDTQTVSCGPLLVISGERGHLLTIDKDWRETARATLTFLSRSLPSRDLSAR